MKQVISTKYPDGKALSLLANPEYIHLYGRTRGISAFAYWASAESRRHVLNEYRKLHAPPKRTVLPPKEPIPRPRKRKPKYLSERKMIEEYMAEYE